jgi:hypothetical protein
LKPQQRDLTLVLRRPVEPAAEKRTLHEHREFVAIDPQGHFATANYCIAKDLFNHLVGSEQDSG